MNNSFKIIDAKIDSFRDGKFIGLSKKAKTDWLQFEYRKLFWKKNEVGYQMEIFPTFNSKEEISAWNLTCWAHFDSNGYRHTSRKTLLKSKEIKKLTGQLDALLQTGFAFLNNLKDSDFSEKIKLKK